MLAGLLLFSLVLFMSIQTVMAEEEDEGKEKEEDDDNVELEQEGEHEGENEGYTQAGFGLLMLIPTVGFLIYLLVRKRNAQNRVVPEKVVAR